MSKAKKILLIVASVFVIGGAILAFGAFAVAGFDFKNLSTEDMDWNSTTRTFEVTPQDTSASLVVRIASGDVSIEPTDGSIDLAFTEQVSESVFSG